MKKTSTPFYKTGVSKSPFEMHEPGHIEKLRPTQNSIGPKPKRPKASSVNEVGSHMGDTGINLGANQSWQGELKSSQSTKPLSEGVQKVKDRQDFRTQILIDRKIKKANKKSTRKQKQEIRQEARNQRKSIRKNNTIL